MRLKFDNTIALRSFSASACDLRSFLDNGRCSLRLSHLPGFESWGSPSMDDNVRLHNLGEALISPFGVVFLDGAALYESYRSRNFSMAEARVMESLPKEAEIRIRSAINIHSPAPRNYYHFLFDYVSRFALIRSVDGFRGFPMVSLNLRAYQRQVLSDLDFALDNIVLCNACWIRVDRLIFVEQQGFGIYFSPQVVAQMRALRDRVAGAHVSAPRALYISRRGLRVRQIDNIDAVEAMMENCGLEIVQPEKMSLTEQARLFSSSRVIVGCSGAALANAAFCYPRATILELRPVIAKLPQYSYFWRNFAERCGLLHRAVDMHPVEADEELSPHRWTFSVNLEALQAAAKEVVESV